MSFNDREDTSSFDDKLTAKMSGSDHGSGNMCQKCGRSDALYSCLECVYSFCEVCVEKHSKWCTGLKSSSQRVQEKGMATSERNDEERSGLDSVHYCKTHTENPLDMFCKQHDEFLCTTCVDTLHRSCKDVSSVSKLAKKVTKSKEFKTLNSDLNDIRSKLVRLKKDRKDDQKKLRQETDESLTALSGFRKDINWVLDRLERKGKGYIEKRYKELNKSIDDDIKVCDDMITDLDKLIYKFKAKEDKTDVLHIVKKGKNTLEVADKVCKEIKSDIDQSEIVKFVVNPKVKEFAMGLGWYGKDKTFLSFAPPVELPHMYSVTNESNFDMKIKGDKGICSITSACQFPDGTFIVTDTANKKVKHVDITYKVVDSVSIAGEPISSAVVSETSSAISVSEENRHYIQFVAIENSRLRKTSDFTTIDSCKGLSASSDNLILAFESAISEYTQEGDCVREIYRDDAFKIQTFVSNDSGSKFVIVNEDGRILQLDSDGAILREMKDDSIKDPRGMCLDRTDQIFVAGYDSSNVYMFSHEGESMGLLLNGRSRRIKQPQMICFDRFNSRLMTGVRGSNGITLFDLK